MANRIGMSRERGINFLVQWTAAKATVAALFIAIGLILNHTRTVMIGAVFGGIGLIGLGNLIVWVGFYSTIGRFQVFFQSISRDLKIAFRKILPKQEESILRLKFTTKGILREFEDPTAPEFLRKTTDFFMSYDEYPKEGVPLLVKSVKPETENGQLKAVTIELGTISIRKILVYRIWLFTHKIKEAIKGIRQKDC